MIPKPANPFCALRLAALAICWLAPLPAGAEPSVSMKHVPSLWAIAAAGAVLVFLAPLLVARRGNYLQSAPKKWGIAIALSVLFLVFVAPLIIALGSILITGRTM